MTFKKWVKLFSKENNSCGDLCRDIAADTEFPAKATSYGTVHGYLVQKLDAEQMTCFEELWKIYSRE